MLQSQLIHPQILQVLGRAGHSSKVLIADGNYPFVTTLGPNAKLVSLNLSPGLVSGTQVLESLVTAIPVEAATVMQYAATGPYGLDHDPPIWSEYRSVLDGAGFTEDYDRVDRLDFYELASQPDVALTIATGEQRIYANLLLTIGVVMPG